MFLRFDLTDANELNLWKFSHYLRMGGFCLVVDVSAANLAVFMFLWTLDESC